MTASQKLHLLRYASSFVTQRTFVRIAPQDLRALNVNFYALPSTVIYPSETKREQKKE
jgi:hypothetical protein